MEYYKDIQKEWNPIICDNIDESGRDCVKWTKSGIERKILHVLTYMYGMKSWSYKRRKSRIEPEKSRAWREWLTGMGYRWIGEIPSSVQ
jgi:hypothetical protein